MKTDRLTRAEADGHRRELGRTKRALRRLSPTSVVNLGAVLHDTAVLARRFNRPRALVLFGELRLNRRWFREHAMPSSGNDVFARNGVLYRSFWGQGLRFHPLGNFARLNGLIAGGRLDEARRLATALVARGITPGPRRTVWEYTFPYGWGGAPWKSGMAQASAAQTLAWAADELGDPNLTVLAGRAYRAIPRRLTLALSSGPWVQLYSFSRLVVLNAQLQSALSIGDYANRTGNRKAARFAARLRGSSSRLFPRFDTGYWSNYSPGNESPLRYHVYVVQLLRKLWQRTANIRWWNRAERFDRYLIEPPILRGGSHPRRLYPRPADGFRDATTVSFWLSKESTVTVRLPGLSSTMHVGKGWHRVVWRPVGVDPGRYRPRLTAYDLAGNKGTAKLDPIRIAVDREPPVVTARLRGRKLSWDAVDRATPWVRLVLRLDRPNRRRWIPLGIHEHRGSLRIPKLAWRWQATLSVFDSTGNRTRVKLGPAGR